MRRLTLALGLTNAYVVQDRRAVVIDTGWPGSAPKVLRALGDAGIAKREISLLLHTHGHVDHAGSSAALRRELGAPVAAHGGDAPMMTSGVNGKLRPHEIEGRLLRPFLRQRFEPCPPDLTIDREISLADFGVAARVLFTPGHTAGSLSILLDNGDAIVGDLLMGGRLGGAVFRTRPRFHYYVADFAQLHASLHRLLSFGPSTLHPGHGGPLRASDVRERLAWALEREPEP